MANYIHIHWSGEPTALQAALVQLKDDPRVADIGPYREITVAGKKYGVVLLAFKEAVKPPTGITEEDPITGSVAVGVYMRGPMKPTPIQWMDRLPMERQEDLLDALSSTKRGRLFLHRLSAAQEIDVTNPETIGGVTMLKAAGVLTAEEAQALLAP